MVENPSSYSHKDEAIVIVKAVPHVSQKYGETVCCAGIDLNGNWVRLYPIPFRLLDKSQQFKRWSRIAYRWRKPKDDPRLESRHVDQDSITVIGDLPNKERESFLAKRIVTSLKNERDKGLSFALLNAKVISFNIEKKSERVISEEAARYKAPLRVWTHKELCELCVM